MVKKLIQLLFLLVLSLCVVTNVLSLFPGTHTLIDLSSDDNDIDCTGCHGEIKKQLLNSSIHAGRDCEYCHRFAGTGIDFAAHTQSGYQVGDQAHAAYTPRCLDCHGAGGYATHAPAFSEYDYGSDVSAHKPLVQQSLAYNVSVGENAACLACHTNYSIKNVFKRPRYFDFTITDAWSVSSIAYGGTNTSTVRKSASGAKHELKASNQIRCEECHSDVWRAANNATPNNYGSYYASHVCWTWDNGTQTYYDAMHNVSYVAVPGGYDNITAYCLLSCHKPTVLSGTPPVNLTDTVHAARRLSCYHCHNDGYSFSVENKPGVNETPNFSSGAGHRDLDNSVLAKPLFLHAETCIACKRAGAPTPGAGGIDFRTYTEPNNRMYKDLSEI